VAIRNRIIAVVLSLVFVALAALDVITYNVVHNSLVSSDDNQISVASPHFWSALFHRESTGQYATNVCDGLPADSFGVIYRLGGEKTDLNAVCTTGNQTPKLPALPAVLLKRTRVAGVASDAGVQPPTVYANLAGYRVGLAVEPVSAFGSPAVTYVVFALGVPLAPVNTTLNNVLLLEMVVTGSILVTLGVAAYFLVMLGLRPLENMAETADEIAAGDLSRRVEETDEKTEVGRLGSALNVMLSRIESAFKDKEASEDRLRRFVADASHELRTPLTSIRGYAELFGRKTDVRPEDLTAALQRIESESARMSGLVEDLLLLARLDQGRPLEQEPVELAPILEDAAADARVVAPGRQITVEVNRALATIGDDGRLRQVVSNLVANALSYSPPESPIELIGRADGGRTRLLVVDHGPGIPSDIRVKIFDRFWRADESRQRAKGGTGLGLSLVAAIVAAHHGTVYVADTPGGGATFVVELPGELSPAPQESPEKGASLPAPGSFDPAPEEKLAEAESSRSR
jgi:two-component system OmpR family sensor kinase